MEIDPSLISFGFVKVRTDSPRRAGLGQGPREQRIVIQGDAQYI